MNRAQSILKKVFGFETFRPLQEKAIAHILDTHIYTSKDGRTIKSFPALEWLAAICSHIPNRGEQMIRYYGWYSNVSRRKRQKEGRDDAIPCILEPLGDEKIFRRNWARLIQKIYEADPLVCPKCQGVMRVISSIEDSSGHPGHPQSHEHLAGSVSQKAQPMFHHPFPTAPPALLFGWVMC
jgi:hypothetical protein